jgi:hypothetical protein
VWKHFASYQGYPKYRWDLIWYTKGKMCKEEWNEMGRKCSTFGEENRILGFDGETCGKETTWEDPIVDGRMLRWIFRKWDVGVWTGLSRLRIGTGGRHL